MTYTFTWKHNKSLIQLPVKITKTVDNDYDISGKMVCPVCVKKGTKKKVIAKLVKQKYHCETCGFEGTSKDCTHRYDEDENITFTKVELKSFMEEKVEQVIIVVKELPMSDVLLNIEFINDFNEIYSNENDTAKFTITKVHKWLMKHHVALLVNYGHRQKNRTGLIVATKDRLLLAELRDYRKIRAPKQEGIVNIKSNSVAVLNANTESTEPAMYANFIKALRSGKKIKVPEKKKEKPTVTVASFLED